MSRRESRVKGISLTTIGGVNERVRDVELPLHEYTRIEGLFPEFAGLQSRMWGKRVLEKYAEAIYGIHQFWTPQGYGGGLYQFDGKLDYGQWLTPTSNFDLTIPPLSFDGGGMTLDEFGLPYGSNFGYGTDNTCLISFLNGSTDHSACNPPPAPADTPNDSNGGPAGQGRKCRWTQGTPTTIGIPAPNDTMFGVWNSPANTFPSGPVPYPVEPTVPAEKPSIYSPGSSGFGNIWFAQAQSVAQKINLGFGNWIESQTANSQNTKGNLDLSSVIDPANPPSLIEVEVRHNGNFPFVREWVMLTGAYVDPTFTAIPIDVYDYIQPNYRHDDGGLGGYINSDFVVLERIRLSYNGRVCT